MFIKQFTFVLTLIASVLTITPSFAQESATGFLMTETEKEAIREIVKEYIENNPELIVKTVEEDARKKAQKLRDEKMKVSEIPAGLHDNAPMAGDADGDITVVEFFDYNCGYCKRIVNDVNRLTEDEDSIKVVFRELPILNDASELAARYALAADKQGKYLEYHTKLMQHRGGFDVAALEKYGTELELDVAQLTQDANSQDVLDAIAENMEFARTLQVRGTPFFLVGQRKVPGAIGYTRLKTIIEEEKARMASESAS